MINHVTRVLASMSANINMFLVFVEIHGACQSGLEMGIQMLTEHNFISIYTNEHYFITVIIIILQLLVLAGYFHVIMNE